MRISRLLIATILGATLLGGLAHAQEQDAGEGKVIWKDRRCAFFIVQSSWGFTLFEFLNGPWPNDDDVISGRLDGFGSRNVINKTAAEQTTMVYSEVSSTSKKHVGNKIPGFCKRKKDFLAQLEQPAESPPATPPAQ